MEPTCRVCGRTVAARFAVSCSWVKVVDDPTRAIGVRRVPASGTEGRWECGTCYGARFTRATA